MLKTIEGVLTRIITWTAVLFFLAGAFFYTFQILWRFLFNDSFFWIDALISYLFTLAALLGAGLAVRSRDNIKIDVFRKYAETRGVRLFTDGFALSVTLVLLVIFFQHSRVLYRGGSISLFGAPDWLLNLPYLILFLGSSFYYLQHLLQTLQSSHHSPDKTTTQP